VFRKLVMAKKLPFAFETVFSHWRQLADGSFESKASEIRAMQAAGHYVVLLFVGLVSEEISVARVRYRRDVMQGTTCRWKSFTTDSRGRRQLSPTLRRLPA
jgi:predicted ABC-type ATPase